MSIKTILIVDEKLHMRNLIRVYLAEAGYRTIESEDGGQALRTRKDTGIDMVLLDIIMPHMDGWTGLGLPIAKEIVELHGGHIEVASVEGEGTVFQIHLPVT